MLPGAVGDVGDVGVVGVVVVVRLLGAWMVDMVVISSGWGVLDGWCSYGMRWRRSIVCEFLWFEWCIWI